MPSKHHPAPTLAQAALAADEARALPSEAVPHDEVDATEAEAMQDSMAAAVVDQAVEHITEDGEIVQSSGVRARKAWAMKNFLPGNSQAWINAEVVAKGKGTHVIVGRIIGQALRADRKAVDWQGKQLESIALTGQFEAIPVHSNVPQAFSVLYLPMAFALQVEQALQSEGVRSVPLDVDIGVEATGKTIAFEWTVTSYLEGSAQRAMRRLRESRQTGRAALPAPSKPAPLSLAAG